MVFVFSSDYILDVAARRAVGGRGAVLTNHFRDKLRARISLLLVLSGQGSRIVIVFIVVSIVVVVVLPGKVRGQGMTAFSIVVLVVLLVVVTKFGS